MKCLFVRYNKLEVNDLHLGLASLIAVAKSEHVICEYFDTTYIEDEHVVQRFQETLERFSPDVLAVTCTTPNWKSVKQLLSITLTPDVKAQMHVIIGGVHPTVVPESVIALPYVDIIAIGEGEISFRNILRSIANNTGFEHIKGIWYKRNGNICKNPVEHLIANLDELPYSDWELFDQRLFYKVSDRLQKMVRIPSFETSRGCPYSCTYCTNPYYKDGLYHGDTSPFFRKKSPERVVAEIEQKLQRFDFPELIFMDEEFIGNFTRLESLAKLYAKKLHLPASIMTRPETLTPKSAPLLVEMGINRLFIGIEAGNARYRREMLDRQLSNQDIIDKVKLVKQYGISVIGFNIIGLPFETKEMVWETIELNKQAEVDFSVVLLFRPYPATRLFDVCIQHDLFIKDDVYDYDDCSSTQSMIRIALSPEEIYELRQSFPNSLKLLSEHRESEKFHASKLV